MIAFALVLLLGAAAGWIAAEGAPARARAYLHFAAVLYGVLSWSELAMSTLVLPLAYRGFVILAVVAVRDMVVTLGTAVLSVAAFAAFRKKPATLTATLVLALAALAGMASAATGFRLIATLPQVFGAAFTFLIARHGLWRRASIYLSLAAVAMLFGAACAFSPGAAAHAGILLFAAAELVGVATASDVLVEQREKDDRLAVSRSR